MRKFSAFSQHLLAWSGLPREQFACFADMGRPEFTGEHLGFITSADGQSQQEQLELGRWVYDCVIHLERYSGSGTLLVAAVIAWLRTHDDERHQQNLPDPEISINVNDLNTADVEISVTFEEVLTVIEDAAGSIELYGKKWSLTEPQIVPVEDFTLSTRLKGAGA